MNNNWLKPLITFAVGIILGVGVMYLTGVRLSISPTGFGEISSVPGFASTDFSLIKDNGAVTRADVFVTLRGSIRDIKDNTITIVNGSGKPITIVVNENALIFEQPRQEGATVGTPRQFTFNELKPGDMLDVFGLLQGSTVIAESVFIELPPPPPAQ